MEPNRFAVPAVILVVDDDASVRDLLCLTLGMQGHRMLSARDGEQALLLAAAQPFDLVVLDQGLPGMSGAEVLERLRRVPHLQTTRILVLSGSPEGQDLATMLHAGAHDYVAKPFEPAELVARVDACLRVKREMDVLTTAALHCALTGLMNRRGGELELSRCQAHSLRSGEDLAVLMLDVDGFKTINDTFGHAVGDLALRHVAVVLTGALREGDALARWGGDELLAILPSTDLEGSDTVARRFLNAVSAQPLVLADGRSVALAVSAGAASHRASTCAENGSGAATAQLLAAADAALYRNRQHR